MLLDGSLARGKGYKEEGAVVSRQMVVFSIDVARNSVPLFNARSAIDIFYPVMSTQRPQQETDDWTSEITASIHTIVDDDGIMTEADGSIPAAVTEFDPVPTNWPSDPLIDKESSLAVLTLIRLWCKGAPSSHVGKLLNSPVCQVIR
jgi:hypothetical protein